MKKKVIYRNDEVYEFNVFKNYFEVTESYVFKIIKTDSGQFSYVNLGTSIGKLSTFDTFEDLINSSNYPIYILNDKEELSQLINGDRNFPEIKKLREIQKLKDNEISSQDVDLSEHIYAGVYNNCLFGKSFTSIMMLDCNGMAYLFSSNGLRDNSVNNCQDYCFNKYDMYQFDTYEEFVQWQMELINNGKM